MSRPKPIARVLAGLVLLALFGLIVWAATRPARQPGQERVELARDLAEGSARRRAEERDARLVRQLLAENLDQRSFSFATVLHACSGARVLPLDRADPAQRRVVDALEAALDEAVHVLSQPGSPAREHGRINEVSAEFETFLQQRLDATPGLSCGIPPTRDGETQRSGYPDLRIEDEASGLVVYLDPKLAAADSRDSSFRSFYFAPKDETLKVTEDAVHLLVGIFHDGRTGAWRFGPWQLVDLSRLEVRLKAEFQASNRDLYPDP